MSGAAQLERGLAALGIELPLPARQRLLDYCALLKKWNRVYNLTALRDDDQLVSLHLLDSLAVLPHLGGATLADIGSGGGLPGIPLAIASPARRVALIESSHKKASFLQQGRIELKLDNVVVHNVRVEAWQPAERFDAVITRAFSDLAGFVGQAQHLLAPGGAMLAMKGIYPHEELAQVSEPFAVREVIALRVPEVDAARHLIVIARKG
jgi:16S rRNA (guanine527-N7)-methyltransferase